MDFIEPWSVYRSISDPHGDTKTCKKCFLFHDISWYIKKNKTSNYDTLFKYLCSVLVWNWTVCVIIVKKNKIKKNTIRENTKKHWSHFLSIMLTFNLRLKAKKSAVYLYSCSRTVVATQRSTNFTTCGSKQARLIRFWLNPSSILISLDIVSLQIENKKFDLSLWTTLCRTSWF